MPPTRIIWLYTFTVIIVLYITGTSAKLSKTRIFLQQATLGGSRRMTPEEILYAADPDIESNELLDGFNAAVLIGNYGNIGPPHNKMMRKVLLMGNKEEKAPPEPVARSMVAEIKDPASQVELQHGRQYPMSLVMDGIEALSESQDQMTAISRPGSSSSLVATCLKKLALCALLPAPNVLCYLHCVMESNPSLSKLPHVFTQNLNKMCDSLGTIFYKLIERLEGKMSNMKRLDHFMMLFDVGAEHYKSYAHKAADALEIQIINNIDRPQLAEYRASLLPLKRLLGLSDKSFKMVHTMSNEGCKNISYLESSKQFVDFFNKKPTLADIMLPGYNLAKLIAHFLPGQQQVLFTSFHNVVNSVVGTPCDLINNAEMGAAAECDVNGDDPQVVELPSQYQGTGQYQGACGTIPEFPGFDWSLGFKMPSMDSMRRKKK